MADTNWVSEFFDTTVQVATMDAEVKAAVEALLGAE
jgi:hypothetical protein